MVTNPTVAVDMPYSKMKEYLSEWYYEAEFSTIQRAAGYDSVKIFNILKENHTGEEVFVWMTDVGAPLVEDTMVSTSGIVGDELRGLIEQCYLLDKQLEASEKATETKKIASSQKGE